jgi:hypothetical protein
MRQKGAPTPSVVMREFYQVSTFYLALIVTSAMLVFVGKFA